MPEETYPMCKFQKSIQTADSELEYGYNNLIRTIMPNIFSAAG